VVGYKRRLKAVEEVDQILHDANMVKIAEDPLERHSDNAKI